MRFRTSPLLVSDYQNLHRMDEDLESEGKSKISCVCLEWICHIKLIGTIMISFHSTNDDQNKPKDFKWKHFSHEIILWTLRWYCQFSLSYRDLVLMMAERGLSISHTTIMRWIHEYAPKLEKRVKRQLKMTNDSWRVDETYMRVGRDSCGIRQIST
jgi:hypothetical protein